MGPVSALNALAMLYSVTMSVSPRPSLCPCGCAAAGSQISEAGARHLRTVPLLNIRACEGVAVDVQLQHSPIRFDHLRSAISQNC